MSQPSICLQSVGEPSNDSRSSVVFSYMTYTDESTESSTADYKTESDCGSYDSIPFKELMESSTIDEETEHECSRDEDSEITYAALANKVKEYRRRNKKLSIDYNEQQRILQSLQNDYANIKLKLAEVQTELDSKEMMTQELIASRDLRLLELVKERNDLENQVRNDANRIKQKDRTIAQLEKSLQRKELRLFETVQEHVNVKTRQHAIKARDADAKELRKSDSVEENIVLVPTVNSLGHWLSKNLRRPSPAKRKMWEKRVIPVDR